MFLSTFIKLHLLTNFSPAFDIDPGFLYGACSIEQWIRTFGSGRYPPRNDRYRIQHSLPDKIKGANLWLGTHGTW
jgi:hypothetical protein